MVKLKSILLSSMFLGTLLTGCSHSAQVGPDLNNAGDILFIPPAVLQNGSSTQTGEPSGDESIDTQEPSDSGDVVPEELWSPISPDVMDSKQYRTYLQSEVLQPLKDIVNNSDSDKLYLRVFHSGYTKDSNGNIKQDTVLDSKVSFGISSIAGKSLPSFVYRWLSPFSFNEFSISNARDTALAGINNSYIPNDIKFSELDRSEYVISDELYKMWGGLAATSNNDTFGFYKERLEDDFVSTVPNVSMFYYSSIGTKSIIKLNDTNLVSSWEFIPQMDLSNVNRVFTRYNQSADRSYSRITGYIYDKYSKLFYFVDGYNKTLVLLATSPDSTLDDELSEESIESVNNIFTSICDVTDSEIVSQILDEPIIILEGSN